MSMKEKGRIVYIAPIQSGVSKAGKNWQKQLYALETDGQYPKKIAFSIMNDKIALAAIQMGHTVEIEADAESREYQGKWYTEIIAWRINNHGFVQPSTPAQSQPVYQQQPPQGFEEPRYAQSAPAQTQSANPFPQQPSDDLPF